MLILLVLKILEDLVVLGELVMLVGMIFYFCSMEETGTLFGKAEGLEW